MRCEVIDTKFKMKDIRNPAPKLANDMNEWLDNHPNIKIHHIVQFGGPQRIMTTFFYED